jgi:hypothetical protein
VARLQISNLELVEVSLDQSHHRGAYFCVSMLPGTTDVVPRHFVDHDDRPSNPFNPTAMGVPDASLRIH